MKSLFPDICSTKLNESKAFYIDLFSFDVVFELDWYLQLKSPKDDNLQLAFVQQDHSSVPLAYQQPPQGVVVTIETDDVDGFYKKAQKLGCEIVLELCDEQWGQHHFMVVDPNGLLVDVYCMLS